MTLRRLNWTERRRITQDQARLTLHREGGRTWFSAEFQLAEHELPSDALVVVEAYRQTTWQRFPFGTVGLVRPPASTDLSEFGEGHGVKFRVKVLGGGAQSGRILAEADRIVPSDPETAAAGRDPLLPVRGEDLGAEVWQLRLETDSGPELLVNRRLDDWRAVARLPAFIWFVYPDVLRRIMACALEQGTDAEDEESWATRWIRFAVRLPGVRPPPEEGESDSAKDEWINDVVQAFCRQQRLMDRFAGQLLSS